MVNYVMMCESGTMVLVSANTSEDAEREWDESVDAGGAEPRIDGTTRLATPADVRRCVALGHDYRLSLKLSSRVEAPTLPENRRLGAWAAKKEIRMAALIDKRFAAAIENPVRDQLARTPDDPSGYIARHLKAWKTPSPGFEAAIVAAITALRGYATMHELAYNAKLANDGVLGDAWLDALRGVRGLLNGQLGRLDAGFLDAALCGLHRAAGFEGEL
jgi:hypothetical protein